MSKKILKITWLLLVSFLFGLKAYAVEYKDDFGGTLKNWTIVDLANKDKSAWKIENKQLLQKNNIGNGAYYSQDYRGTVALYNNFFGSNFELNVDFNNKDNDGVGMVFGYKNSNDFYQLMIFKQESKTVLSKIKNGSNVILQETQDTYKPGKNSLKINSSDSKLTVYLNNVLVITNDFNQPGKVGLTTWINDGASFDNFSLKQAGQSDVVKAQTVEPITEKAVVKTPATLLVRTASSPEVYMIINGKRHKILSPEVFDDYGFKWTEVKTISQEQLQSYPIAIVAKTASSPTVYYLHEPLNKKKPILTPEIFLAYGNKWSDIVTISQKDLDSYGAIRVIKTADSSTVYELKDGVKKELVSSEDFTHSGYQWGEVVTVRKKELDYYPTKVVVNGEEMVVAGVEFDESAGGEQSVAGQIITGNRYLSIKTIKKNKEIAVPTGTIITMLQLQLTAGLEHSVDVNTIEVGRERGVSKIKKIFIANDKNEVLGTGEFIDSNQAVVKLKKPINIAPNTSQTINVNVLMEATSYPSTEQLLINSSQSIISNAYISGVFPLIGDRFSVIDGKKLVGAVKIASVKVNDGLRSARIGAKDQLITKFSLEETTGNEDIYLEKLKIKQSGSTYSKLANIDLVDQNNKVLATLKNPSSNELIFDMSFAPYKIIKGSKQIFSLRADIIDGPGGTTSFTIQESTDIFIKGSAYNFRLIVASDEKFPIGRSTGTYANSLKINDANTLLYKNSKSPVGNLVPNSKDQVLGMFDIRVDGRDLDWEAIKLQIVQEGSVNLDGYVSIRDIKTKKIVGQIGASQVANKLETINLDNLVNIKSGQTYTFEVIGDISEESDILSTYQVRINGLDFLTSDSRMAYHFDYETLGNILGVKKTSLTITADNVQKDKSEVAGTKNVLIGSFILQAGVAEDVVVNSFNIQEAANYDTINFGDGYANLKITVNGKNYAVYEMPSDGPFIVNTPFTIRAGTTVSVKVYVDTTPIISSNKIKLSLYSVEARGKISNLPPSQTTGNVLSATTEFRQNILAIIKNEKFDNAMITANGLSQQVASFVFKNTGIKDIRINNFTILETDGSSEISYNNGYQNLRASLGGSKKPIAGGNIFGGFTVRPNQEVVINIFITPDTTTAGDQFSLIIKDIKVDGAVNLTGDPTVGQNVRVVAKN